jgi:hypothetical protein
MGQTLYLETLLQQLHLPEEVEVQVIKTLLMVVLEVLVVVAEG